MRKFRVIVPQQAGEKVVAELHEAGLTQLKEISEIEVTKKAIGEEVQELSSFLSELNEIQEFLGSSTVSAVEVGQLTNEKLVASAKKLLNGIKPKLVALRAKKKDIEEKKGKLLATLETIRSIRNIGFPLEYLRPTDEICTFIGRIEEEKLQEFITFTKKELEEKVLFRTFGKEEKRIFVLVCNTKDGAKISPLLYRYDVELLELPKTLPPTRPIESLEMELGKLKIEEKKLGKEIKKLARAKAREISALAEMFRIKKERLESWAMFGFTDVTMVIEGWTPTEKVSELDAILSNASGQRYLLRTYEPSQAEIEKVPTEMKNPKVVEDFEFVTGMYGMPKYDEVDPTPFLAFTFAMFFGICLGDAGYGLVLGLFMASGLWFSKVFPKNFRRMMVFCAASSIIIGALIGGWFGFGALLVDPIKNPVPLIKLAIFIGVIHVVMGFGILGTLKDIFRKDWKNLFLNDLAKAIMATGFFGLSFCIFGVGLREFGIDFTFPKLGLFDIFNPLAPAPVIVFVLRMMFYLGLVFAIVGAALRGKSTKEKVGGSVNVVYGVTGLVADAASYSRLMALGMATSIIAFAINYVIGMIYNGALTSLSGAYTLLIVPLLIGLAIVFFVAHCANIFLGTLGGFVHTMRLHFVEFFSKFYEGGGEKFTPFKAKRVFTKLKRGE